MHKKIEEKKEEENINWTAWLAAGERRSVLWNLWQTSQHCFSLCLAQCSLRIQWKHPKREKKKKKKDEIPMWILYLKKREQ